MRKNNFILIGCLAGFIGLVFFFMRGLPYGEHTVGYGPAFYPTLLLGLLGLLTLVLLLQTLKSPKDVKEEKKEDEQKKAFGIFDVSFRNFGFFLVLFLFYAITLNITGFIINSLLFLFIAMKYLKASLKQAVFVSVIVVAVIFVMFRIVLRVPLPSGILEGIGL